MQQANYFFVTPSYLRPPKLCNNKNECTSGLLNGFVMFLKLLLLDCFHHYEWPLQQDISRAKITHGKWSRVCREQK